ncbi:MAG: hypothetical protein Solivirus1_64 [Solivirus sp.]|uniref:Uncharacterized protein n=1 Tax=Solivirus sp. TaxID=2487772 RepID=A0A3G5AFF1_9VIRU|nr:MAG: hypothetical protein Solivirus1_64 [Solivirus sp.]
MLTFSKYGDIFLIKSCQKSIGFAIIFEDKTFMINPTPELVKFCCCTDSATKSSSNSSNSSNSDTSRETIRTVEPNETETSRVCHSCFVIRTPLIEIPKSKEILLAKYHNKNYLFVPKLEMVFIFEHDLEETLVIAKRLSATKIVTPKGSIITASELLICSIIN